MKDEEIAPSLAAQGSDQCFQETRLLYLVTRRILNASAIQSYAFATALLALLLSASSL